MMVGLTYLKFTKKTSNKIATPDRTDVYEKFNFARGMIYFSKKKVAYLFAKKNYIERRTNQLNTFSHF